LAIDVSAIKRAVVGKSHNAGFGTRWHLILSRLRGRRECREAGALFALPHA
jgi:hypothetical protein